ncbi:MAG: SCO1664 family protein, partial [Mycobacterium sp.]|nr:SCO1664 family protein [Mycobacterium sp.]
EDTLHCVYKPVAGEQPLWDFPDGTLAGREYGAFLISAALGWDVVPHTIIRDGPAGLGMVQVWVEQPDDDDEDQRIGTDLVDLCPADAVPAGYLSVLSALDYTGGEVTLVHADDLQLRRMAVFDVIVNNADRKGGHILSGVDGRVYGVDHGLALHVQDKLRTVLWGWAGKPIDDPTLEAVAALEASIGGPLGSELREHITAAELAALRRRVQSLLDNPVMPNPERSRPLPWPAF